MDNTAANKVIAGLGIVAGVSAFIGTQAVSSEMFAPIMNSCTAGETAELHEYVPWLGGSFICMITQFLLALATEPAGILAWGLIAGLAGPAVLWMYAEAGRTNATGLLRWPALVLLLSQVLGISVIFPSVWLPAFALRNSQLDGALTKGRVLASVALCFVLTPFTILLFTLDPTEHSSAWAHVAGFLGGPGPAAMAMLLWAFPPPARNATKAAAEAQELLVLGHAALAGSAFLAWIINVCLAVRAFGASPVSIAAALWGPNAAVRFMTIDLLVLFIGVVGAVFVDRGATAALKVVLLAPLIGPGASFGLYLIQREQAIRARFVAALSKEKQK